MTIGRGFAIAGAKVVLVGRKPESLSQAARNFPGEVDIKQCDVLEEDQIDELVEHVIRRYGKIDILLNSAGRTIRSPAEELSVDDWDQVIRVNLRATFAVSQKVARQMIERKQPGSIINIGSLMSEAARSMNTAYAASKGGVKLLTKSLAVEWARYGIRVNCIGPGYFVTEMTKPLVEDHAFDMWVKQRTPLGRWGNLQELIGCAVFLASEAASFITGETVYVDGGWLAQL